jgi:hypothetical protein
MKLWIFLLVKRRKHLHSTSKKRTHESWVKLLQLAQSLWVGRRRRGFVVAVTRNTRRGDENPLGNGKGLGCIYWTHARSEKECQSGMQVRLYGGLRRNWSFAGPPSTPAQISMPKTHVVDRCREVHLPDYYPPAGSADDLGIHGNSLVPDAGPFKRVVVQISLRMHGCQNKNCSAGGAKPDWDFRSRFSHLPRQSLVKLGPQLDM